MKVLLLLFGMIGVIYSGFSQTIIFPYEENFEWQVKQIDEFIDRFNNADYTPIRQFLKEQYDIETIDRLKLLKTLFNLEKAWNREQVVQFLLDVSRSGNSRSGKTSSKEPPYLDFYDQNWYAALECQGLYRGKPQNFTLILSIQANEETGASKWVINSISADFLPDKDTADLAFTLNGKSLGSHTLNPASFGTDFMALVEALADTANYKNYISHEKANHTLLTFFDLLYQQQLVFQQVNHITYHFLQVPGWVFQVENFPRQTNNSGWLINQLLPMSDAEKEVYQKQTLYLDQR